VFGDWEYWLRVQGSVSRVKDSVSRVWGLGIRVLNLGFRVNDLKSRVSHEGCGGRGLEFSIEGFRARNWCLGFRFRV